MGNAGTNMAARNSSHTGPTTVSSGKLHNDSPLILPGATEKTCRHPPGDIIELAYPPPDVARVYTDGTTITSSGLKYKPGGKDVTEMIVVHEAPPDQKATLDEADKTEIEAAHA